MDVAIKKDWVAVMGLDFYISLNDFGPSGIQHQDRLNTKFKKINNRQFYLI